MKVALGLVHWPIRDKVGNIVATNITHLDVHDIARACRVYGVEKFFIIHPMRDQLVFVARILEHWRVGEGSVMNPMRKTALNNVVLVETVEKACGQWGESPVLVGTTAREKLNSGRILERVPFPSLRERIEREDGHLLILFGTGYGLSEDLLEKVDCVLSPIRGSSHDDYRHLSVRSAVSVCLDRLMGL